MSTTRRQCRRRLHAIALGAVAWTSLGGAPAGAAEPWVAPLQRGGQVEVDPRTNRPVLTDEGRETQLWDGVHRLEDGSVIRIQGGRVVPTTEMLTPVPAPMGGETGEGDPGAAAPIDAAKPNEPESSIDPAVPTGPIAPPRAASTGGASPCEELVVRVCGASRLCWREPACDAARQLRELEQEDRIRGAAPDGPTPTGRQCREALANPFFAPCAD